MNNKSQESLGVRFLYHTVLGRIVLKLITRRFISKIVGAFLSSPLSKPKIKSFANKNNIDLKPCKKEKFDNFNDFFTREYKSEARPFDMTPSAFVSPCDGHLSVYKIKEGLVIPVKQSVFSVSSMLRNENLAEKFDGGLCLVFRLCVDNYHRYAYFDNAEKEDNVFIPGVLHTVRPTALEKYPVFTENCREYTVMHTENFGDAVQIEVGALLVGKIKNHDGAKKVLRSQEKGMFLFGGSTIILLLEKDRVRLEGDIKTNAPEVNVLMGQKLGSRC